MLSPKSTSSSFCMALAESMQYLTLLIGPSYSGKSTYLKKDNRPIIGANDVILSSDDFRQVICGDASDQSQNRRVFDTMRVTCKDFLYEKKSVVIDATNITKKDRKGFLDLIIGTDIYCQAIVFKFDRATLLARIAGRDRVVPIDVIDRQIAKYQPPDISEFDKIHYV